MTDERATEVQTKGFFRKTAGVALRRAEWLKIIDTWPLPKVCRGYATRNFVCAHGASGKLHDGCRKKHKNWADLSTEEKSKMKKWVIMHSTTFTLLES